MPEAPYVKTEINSRRCTEGRASDPAGAVRGTKPHKSVWIAHCKIPHTNGWMEKFICGVFADRDTAASSCRAQGGWQGHGPFTESRYYDGDVYLYDKTGHQRYVIQRHPVEIETWEKQYEGRLHANASS